jgi:hypothetical protein
VSNALVSRVTYPNLSVPDRTTTRTSSSFRYRFHERLERLQALRVETVRTGRQHLPSILISIHRRRRARLNRRRKLFSANRALESLPVRSLAFFRISFQLNDDDDEKEEENVSNGFSFSRPPLLLR